MIELDGFDESDSEVEIEENSENEDEIDLNGFLIVSLSYFDGEITSVASKDLLDI